MTSGFAGADVAQLRHLSVRLKAQSAKLREIATSSSFALMAAEWTGNDIDAIRTNWNRKSAPMLKALASSLHDMGVELERQALEQERASGGSGGGPSTSWWDEVRRGVENWFLGILIPAPLLPGIVEPRQSPPGQDLSDSDAFPTAPTPVAEDIPDSKLGPLSPRPSQKDYDSRKPVFGDLSPGRNNDGQCTSWVAFRRSQLGMETGAAGRGFNGGQWAENMPTQLAEPEAGAVGSHGNHTFIVEQVVPGPPKSIVISEMNNSGVKDGGLGKVNTDTYVLDEKSGLWKSPNRASGIRMKFGT